MEKIASLRVEGIRQNLMGSAQWRDGWHAPLYASDSVLFAGKPEQADAPNRVQFPKESPLTGRIIEKLELTTNPDVEVQEIVIDVSGQDFEVAAGQSVAVMPPANEPTWPRFYSVAEIQRDEAGKVSNIALCVKRNIKVDDDGAVVKRGKGSNFLCDQLEGDEIQLLGPFGEILKLPDDPSANIILVATGTGVASYRALLQERFEDPEAEQGKTILTFGVPTEDDLFYDDEFHYYRQFEGYDYWPALSQDDGKFVTDRLMENSETVMDLLKKPNTYIYVCGLNVLEDSVYQALEHAAAKEGENWEALVGKLKAEGRWRVETKPLFKQYLIDGGLEDYTRANESAAEKSGSWVYRTLVAPVVRLLRWLASLPGQLLNAFRKDSKGD